MRYKLIYTSIKNTVKVPKYLSYHIFQLLLQNIKNVWNNNVRKKLFEKIWNLTEKLRFAVRIALRFMFKHVEYMWYIMHMSARAKRS